MFNKKNFVYLILCSLPFSAIASEGLGSWSVFGPFKNKDSACYNPAGATSIPTELKINEDIYTPQLVHAEQGLLDLNKIIPSSGVDSAWIFANVRSQQPQKTFWGAGCDWYMTWYVNGDKVFDSSSTGNGLYPPALTDYKIPVKLRQGDNLVAVLFRRGGASAKFVVGTQAEYQQQVDADKLLLKTEENEYLPKLLNTRPRLFINPDMLKAIKEDLQPIQKTYLEKLKKRIDAQPLTPTLEPFQNSWGTINDWGHMAAGAATLWLFTGEKQYLDKAKSYLVWSADWYNQRFQAQKAISWYSYSRINALCAYDWIYNDLSEQERLSIGQKLMQHLQQTMDVKTFRRFDGEGSSGPKAGYYGTVNLWWYGGLLFHKAGINDTLARTLMAAGYRDHKTMFEHRINLAAGVGGPITQSVSYALGDYWKQEFRFFYSWMAATGENYADRIEQLAELPEWIIRCSIPHHQPGMAYDFGNGDCAHFHNTFTLPYAYLAQHHHFYGKKYQDFSQIALYLLNTCGANIGNRVASMHLPTRGHCMNPIKPLLFQVPEGEAAEPQISRAKFYPGIGQTYMSSGRGKDDTYILFTAGGSNMGHKHFDEGNFIIYKNGFQAMDTGARLIYSGMEVDQDYITNCEHGTNYFLRTIAHNCLLIHDPDEDFGTNNLAGDVQVKRVNDGGMCRSIGGRMLSFESNDIYTFAAADLTGAYNAAKAEKVIRNFLFIYPNTILIYDEVQSKKPSFRKTFLLHPGEEPEISQDAWTSGAMQVLTLLPENPVLTKIGGPGAEFMSGAVNWPIAEKDQRTWREKKYLYGDWRVEVNASEEKSSVHFLHFINLDGTKRVPVLTRSKNHETVTVTTETGKYEVRFSKTGPPAVQVRAR